MIQKQLKFVLSIVDILNKLRKSPYLLFIRARGMEPVGIVTKIELKYDPGWGIMRSWAKGLTFDGKKFEEPLDRKNKRTGELEDLVQMKNDLLIITARNSTDPDDDNEANFQYFMNPHMINDTKDKLDSVKEKDRIIHDLEKRLKEATTKMDTYRAVADSVESEVNSLRERVRNLSERLSEQTQRAEEYKRQLKELQIGLIREESKLDEKLKTSDRLGKLEGKDSADLILEAAKKQAMAREELDKLGMGGLTAYATKTDLEKLKQEIVSALSKQSEREQPKEEEEEKK